MKKLILIISLIVLVMPAFALTDEYTLTLRGECKSFDVIIENSMPGCWDVKIEAPGEVMHIEGWKDSFFYVQNAVCDNQTSIIRTRLSTDANLIATIKLRQGNIIVEQPMEITQNCPNENQYFFPAVLFVIAILLALVWYEVQHRKI